MPFSRPEYEYLATLLQASEDQVRRTIDPYFPNAFHAIALQNHRLTHTIGALVSVRGNLCAASDALLDSIRGLRVANPNRAARGTQHLQRVFSDKSLLREDCKNDKHGSNKENINPQHSCYDDDDNEYEIIDHRATHASKLAFERSDYSLRHRLEGIKTLMDIADDRIEQLSLRKSMCDALEHVGVKWARGVFESYDVERIAAAEGEVAEGTVEMREVWGLLDVLMKRDFTLAAEAVVAEKKKKVIRKRRLALEWDFEEEKTERKRQRPSRPRRTR